jgi:hypothetical protein
MIHASFEGEELLSLPVSLRDKGIAATNRATSQRIFHGD